jgi:hypothetical protein
MTAKENMKRQSDKCNKETKTKKLEPNHPTWGSLECYGAENQNP